MTTLIPRSTAWTIRFQERGLTTVEYAIGLLGAAAAALLLMRIFNDNAIFQTLFNWVKNIFASVAAQNQPGA